MKFGFSKRAIILLGVMSIGLTLLFLYFISNDYTLNNDISYGLQSDNNNMLIEKNTATCIGDTSVSLKPTKKVWDQCLQPGKEPSYYLSIVIVTRMDDYAGNQQHRFQNFIDSAYLLAEKTQEKIELIVVEWNPPENRRRVVDSFRFRRSNYLTYRIITVPPSIHKVLPNRGNSPLHEFEGKNVGIRFARGEFVVCTNQDDIWSDNFHNAIKSKAFKKGFLYLQKQAPHNIHENLPPSIVDLPAFTTDEDLLKSCTLDEVNKKNWGHYQLPAPIKVHTDRDKSGFILQIADQAGDFTMAHRDTWKVPNGYREAGGVAWMDIEFICTATWTFDIPVVYSESSFACHQQHPNVWEKNKDQHNDNSNINMGEIEKKQAKYMNEDNKWALLNVDIWDLGLECVQFSGGLCL